MASKNEWVASSADYVKPRAADQADAWTTEAAVQGGSGGQALKFVGEIAPPQVVSSALRLHREDTVIVRQRLITFDGEPVELADTYYPTEIAQGTPLAAPQKIKGGAVACLTELGHLAARAIEHVEARPASPIESDLFTLAVHEPVVVIERLTLDASDAPIQFDVMVAPAKLRRLRYEMKVN